MRLSLTFQEKMFFVLFSLLLFSSMKYIPLSIFCFYLNAVNQIAIFPRRPISKAKTGLTSLWREIRRFFTNQSDYIGPSCCKISFAAPAKLNVSCFEPTKLKNIVSFFLDFAETGKRNGSYENLVSGFNIAFLANRSSFPNVFFTVIAAELAFSYCANIRLRHTKSRLLGLALLVWTALRAHKERGDVRFYYGFGFAVR